MGQPSSKHQSVEVQLHNKGGQKMRQNMRNEGKNAQRPGVLSQDWRSEVETQGKSRILPPGRADDAQGPNSGLPRYARMRALHSHKAAGEMLKAVWYSKEDTEGPDPLPEDQR
jgi:hypothetical protein